MLHTTDLYLTQSDSEIQSEQGLEMPDSVQSHHDGDEEEEQDVSANLTALAQGKLRWGVIKMPPHIQELVVTEDEKEVMHLGFANEEDYISVPKDGELYV